MKSKNYYNENTLISFMNEIKDYSIYTKEEEVAAFKELKSGNKKIENEIILHNIKLVVSRTKLFMNSNIEKMDLIMLGIIGLKTAIQKFDLSYNTKFSTYAINWIDQSIRRGLANEEINLYIPYNQREILLKIKRIYKEFKIKENRTPSIKELSDIIGIQENRINNILINDYNIVSLSTPVGEEDHGTQATLGDYVKSDNNIEEEYIENQRSEDLNFVLDNVLNDKEKEIIKLRFGFYDKIYTLEEVGNMYKVTRERIRQIENIALNKLKRSNKTKNLLLCYMKK